MLTDGAASDVKAPVRVKVGAYGISLVLVFVAFLGYFSFVQERGFTLEVRAYSERAGVAQVFFDVGAGYSEALSSTARVDAGQNVLRFRIPQRDVAALRFDPINNDAVVRITYAALVSSGGGNVEPIPLLGLLPGDNIADLALDDQGLTVRPLPGTSDPQLLLLTDTRPPQEPLGSRLLIDFWWATVATGALAAMLALWRSHQLTTVYVIAGAMLFVAAQIVVMAFVSSSTLSIHPDEFSHVAAYRYYHSHWLPPAVDDPAVIPSLSVYGVSYLFQWGPAYFIAAKSTLPLVDVLGSDVLAARAFNVALWMLLTIVVILRKNWSLAAAIVLMSPQIWYIFSYYNNDALPFILALVCVAIVAPGESSLHRYLRGDAGMKLGTVLFVLCVGLLIVSKQNFLPLIATLFLWLAILHLQLRWLVLLGIVTGLFAMGSATFMSGMPSAVQYQSIVLLAGFTLLAAAAIHTLWHAWHSPLGRPILVRFVVLGSLAGTVALPWIAFDLYQNGLPHEKSERILEVRERHAGQQFKPSVAAAENSYFGLTLARKGVSFAEMMSHPWQWPAITLFSSFGVYGYMSVHPPRWTNTSLALLAAFLVLASAVGAVRNNPIAGAKLVFLSIASIALVILMAALHSWVYDFQPQGRYLLPSIAVFALLLGSWRRAEQTGGIRVLITAAVLIGTISFAGHAMPALLRL
jgi:hypothetical protein